VVELVSERLMADLRTVVGHSSCLELIKPSQKEVRARFERGLFDYAFWT
jgi:hypothetical protein